MARRSTPTKIIDDHAFPVRVKVLELPRGAEWARASKAEAWLRENIGVGNFANHSQISRDLGASAFYFRTVEAAHRFLEALPSYEMADRTEQADHLRHAKEWAASEKVCTPHTVNAWAGSTSGSNEPVSQDRVDEQGEANDRGD